MLCTSYCFNQKRNFTCITGSWHRGTNSKENENLLDYKIPNKKLVHKICCISEALVAHTCNPSYSGGRDHED
jgi:hypothetical protein